MCERTHEALSTRPWIEQVAAGDFAAIPDPFTWDDSAELAHLINGYDASEALGLGTLFKAVDPLLSHYAETETWEGSALELWLALFFLHRSARHGGWDHLAGERENRLCAALREALQHLGEAARATLMRLIADERERLSAGVCP